MSPKKPLRAKLATSVSRSAAALSRATGRGDGAVIGGKIGLMIDPNLLANLAAGREIALVSGTNGKTTTTRLTAAALGVVGEVATNSFGANMPTGHTSALARAGHTPYAVLEVDEHYLPQVVKATRPRVIALLNLSRDQLDRAKEVAMMAELWRDTLSTHPTHVVANADDPMITWAANANLAAGGTVTWVAAGQRWHDDSWVCPECGSHIERGPAPAPKPPVPVAPPQQQAYDDLTMIMPAIPPTGVKPVAAAVPSPPPDPDATMMLAAVDIAASPEHSDPEHSDPEHSDPEHSDPEAGGSETARREAASSEAASSEVAGRGAAGPLPSVAPVQGEPFGAAADAVAIAEEEAGIAGGGGDDWHCAGCSLRRPIPTWHVLGDAVIDPDGHRHVVNLQLPGRVNRANAATALAVAAAFGVDTAAAAARLGGVASIAGRYAQVDRDGRNIRLLLAKNPAGWLEAFDMAEHAPTLLSINSRDPDGLDTSWLFDVDFSPLHGRTVLITGERAYDLAVRLEVNDIPFQHVRTFTEAVSAVPAGRLEVIANYTAFQDIRAELDRVN